jgi:hypothetical protein
MIVHRFALYPLLHVQGHSQGLILKQIRIRVIKLLWQRGSNVDLIDQLMHAGDDTKKHNSCIIASLLSS